MERLSISWELAKGVVFAALFWSAIEGIFLYQRVRFTKVSLYLVFALVVLALSCGWALVLSLLLRVLGRGGLGRKAIPALVLGIFWVGCELAFRLTIKERLALFAAGALWWLLGWLLEPRLRHFPVGKKWAFLLGSGLVGVIDEWLLPGRVIHFHLALCTVGLLLALSAFHDRGRRTSPCPYPWVSAGGASTWAAVVLSAACVLWLSGEIRFATLVLSQHGRSIFHVAGLFASALRLYQRPTLTPSPKGELSSLPELHQAAKRRVLLLSIDSLRVDHLRIYGYPRETAPQITALAEGAEVFLQAYTAAPKTRPALRALFGVTGIGTNEESSNLLRVLAQAGVTTYGAFNNSQSRMFGRWPKGSFHHLRLLPYRPDGGDRETAIALAGDLQSNPCPPVKAEFYWAHLLSPHHPYNRGPKDSSFGPMEADRYDDEIRRADEALGLILQAAAPCAAHTTIVLTADHGEEFGDHGGSTHDGFGMFEEEIHVPLLLRRPSGPGLPRIRHEERISLREVGGMIIRAFGEEREPPRTQGRLGHLFTGPRSLFLSGAVIERSQENGKGRYKLAYALVPFGGARALYDLAVDPKEAFNLIDQEPGIAKTLEGLLQEHLTHLTVSEIRDDL